MTSPYTPRAGSFAEQVLQLLKARGPMSEEALAAECDISIDVLRSSTSTARRYGAIKRAGAPGSNMWRAASGHEGPDVDDEDDLTPVQRVVPAAGQPLPATVLKARATDCEPLEKPAGAELTQAIVQAMAAAPVGNPVQEAVAEELAAAFDRSMLAQASTEAGKPEVQDEAPAMAQKPMHFVGRVTTVGARHSFDLLRERAAQDALLAPAEPPVAREVPCIPQVTVSFNLTPHQAERLCAFAAAMTEVRP